MRWNCRQGRRNVPLVSLSLLASAHGGTPTKGMLGIKIGCAENIASDPDMPAYA